MIEVMSVCLTMAAVTHNLSHTTRLTHTPSHTPHLTQPVTCNPSHTTHLTQQRQFVALPALVKDNTAEPLEASLLADNGEAGATVQLDVEHEVELTITAVEESVVRFEVTTKSPPASQLPVQVDGGMEQPPSLLHGWGAPLALEWLTMQGSWLVVHYWDVLMVLSLVNLAGVLCMALRLYQLERARDMQVVQEVEQFLVDARDVYQDKDLEAPLLASEHRLG